MKQVKTLSLVFGMMMATAVSAQNTVMHFDMSLNEQSQVTETITGQHYDVASQQKALNVESLMGQALRFDGYSNYVQAADIATTGLSAETLTLNVVLAVEAYPMMNTQEAEQTPTFATVCGNLDETAKKGFALELSSQGQLRFRYGASNGYVLTMTSTDKLPLGRWCQVTAVLNKNEGNRGTSTLYLNGTKIASANMSRATIVHNTVGDFMIGKGAADKKDGPFLVNTFCGLIDDISISNAATTVSSFTANSTPDFNYPAERYAETPASLWRPQFHGMPSGSWTNECHGMAYSGGRYHLFFQKNPNGPYQARLHWGHISSANLYDWTEEPIALAPSETYDLKGCWSGCVYEDGDHVSLLYTAVDNGRATIAQATSSESSLTNWQKQGIVINGRPQGLSDDFRDPYYFEADGQKYIIVGTSKNGIGACTLHRWNGTAWTNDGTLFFQGTSASLHGTFWEMPNVTKMTADKWLFTCTPLGTSAGVRTIYWTGTIGSDGKFTPDNATAQYLEMGGVGRDGYGLLSPTICQDGGKTLLVGIVPDKLPTQQNFEMGWAHNFSLPREVSLGTDGTLIQTPYSGLACMRSTTSIVRELSLVGTESLSPVSGRQLELLGEFTIGTGQCGFRFLKCGGHCASLTYTPQTGELKLSMSSLERVSNGKDEWWATLPQRIQEGQQLTLHVWIDGSIADIFVNDRWAFSARLFPTNPNGVEAEAFASSQTAAKISAWVLDPALSDSSGIHDGISEKKGSASSASYNLQGQRVDVSHKGLIIRNGRKLMNR